MKKLTEDDMATFLAMLNTEDQDPHLELARAANLYNRMQKGLAKSWRIKDGRPIHDGDCWFWTKDICTCGLIHQLCPQIPEDEWYAREWGRHERQMDRLPEPLPEPTAEEMKEMEKLMDQEFKKLRDGEKPR